MGRSSPEFFSVRRRIRKWKSYSGVAHLLTVAGLTASLLWVLPQLGPKSALQMDREMRAQTDRRQLLLEAVDKLARYEKYFKEVHGRFTRDLSRLSLPFQLASGDRDALSRDYEISALEVRPNRFLLLATGIGNSDRVTIDEAHRLNANFVLPPPSRSYLLEEADRILRLRAHGMTPDEGIVSRYWRVGSDDSRDWVAVGLRSPVNGERRTLAAADADADSLFGSVRAQLESRVGEGASFRSPASGEEDRGRYKQVFSGADVREWLEAARLAQHVYLREMGRYARRWEELDTVSDFHFVDRIRAVKNLRVHPVEVSGDNFRITIEGTSGDLLGEQFVMDRSGSLRQVRYTEALIHQLQETTNILENFQINPITDDRPSEQ
jgi:hypothetical protein